MLSDDEEFGQSISLTAELHLLVRNYPRGLGVIKEFLQNADDASASSLRVIADWRQHSSDGLPKKEMSALQRAALLFVNDRPFKDPDDFDRIQLISQSGKLRSGHKLGRFGLGFNTAYNITDYPCFVSGSWFVCFDPHEEVVVVKKPAKKPGRRWRLEKLWQDHPAVLQPFIAAGLPDRCPNFDKTIFRLPLRDSDGAKHSDICQLPYEISDFREMVEEAEKSGPSLLLFLKHVLTLEIGEIQSSSSEEVRPLLRFQTVNQDDVKRMRGAISAELSEKLDEALERWTQDPSDLPQRTYQHSFSIERAGASSEEHWQVSQGLFAGPNGVLLKQAKIMADVSEKAVPWAGAAARLVRDGETFALAEPAAGQIFCGLPIQQKVALPIHINGYFDLDASRHSLTTDTGRGDVIHARVRWNEQLLESAVAPACARLLESLTALASEPTNEQAQRFYRYWPSERALTDGALKKFGGALFKLCAELALIRIRSEQAGRWQALTAPQTRLLSKDWHATLLDPLCAAQWQVADPPMPEHLQHGLKNAVKHWPEITAEELRNWLKMYPANGCSLDNAPSPALTRPEWISGLLASCISDAKDKVPLPLHGLPLALLWDGSLHTFGKKGAPTIFIGDGDQLEILANRPASFIDPKFFDSVERLRANADCNFIRMTAQHLAEQLKYLLPAKPAPRPWNPNGDAPPNRRWLLKVYAYLAKQTTADTSLYAALGQLPMVPGPDGHLHVASRTTTPLLPTEGAESDGAPLAAIQALGLPLVTGDVDLILTIQTFAKAHAGFIPMLTGPNLLESLVAHQNRWAAAQSLEDTHDALLDYLGERRWLTQYSASSIQKARSLPLLPTEQGAFVRASDRGVFVQTENRLPTALQVPGIQLLRIGRNRSWAALFEKLDITKLDELAFLNTLLDRYGDLSMDLQRAALRWILETALPALDRAAAVTDPRVATLRAKLKVTNLAWGRDEKLHAVGELYDPDAPLVQEVFGDAAPIPNPAAYEESRDLYLRLFRLLDIGQLPRAPDLLFLIDSLTNSITESNAAATVDRLSKVIRYLDKNWSELGRSICQGQGGKGVELKTLLKNRCWLPAERSDEFARWHPGFKPPGRLLFSPAEIYVGDVADLVGSQEPVCGILRDANVFTRELCVLGVDQIQLSTVARHFEQILIMWQQTDHSQLTPGSVETAVQRIYRHLHLVAQRTPPPKELADFCARFTERPCIWDKAGERFLIPRHTYAVQVPWLEPRGVAIPAVSESVRGGMFTLGHRKAPAAGDYTQHLWAMHDEYGGQPLNKTDRLQTLRILRHLTECGEPLALPMPLLDSEGRLWESAALYFDDAAWLRGCLDPGKVSILHPLVPERLHSKLNGPRLSRDIKELLQREPTPVAADAQLQQLCQQMAEHLRSPEFVRGWHRILHHHQDRVAEQEVIDPPALHIIPSQTIDTTLILKKTGAVVGQNTNAAYHDDEERERLYISSSAREDIVVFIAQALKHRLARERYVLQDTSALEAIIRCQAAEIDRTLDRRAIATAPSADLTYADDPELTDPILQEGADHIDPDFPDEVPATSTEGSSTVGASATRQSDGAGTNRIPNVSSYAPPAGLPISPGFASGEPTSTTSHEAAVMGRSFRHFMHYAGATLPGRVITYVVSSNVPLPVHLDPQPDAHAEAVKQVIEDETKHERRSTRGTAASAYDIFSEGVAGDERYIKVIATRGAWTEAGIPLLPKDFVAAQQYGENYWLYVVEDVLSTSAMLYRIQNPAKHITQFRLDHGWKGLAQIESLTRTVLPKQGDLIQTERGTALVLQVLPAGKLLTLVVRLDDGQECEMQHRPSMTILTKLDNGAQHGDPLP